ncbi:Serine/threonine protein phosphatase 2A regulatory subunit B'subunit alpha [Zostera marina]|uniref:Serine/threonine protein phosphatase 2A regulatory subunit B'subunit alpha n=1 Tax=Zostera marina TaxID=29655 RepID=A0A0K9NZX2_ZOSMR|nr:Serine/threonine protein phosphatase 2A regulatory subunit B'subunit alpha [Zostera marina]
MDPIHDLHSQNVLIDDANVTLEEFFNAAESFDCENASVTPSLLFPSASGVIASLKEIPQFYFKDGPPPKSSVKHRLLYRVIQYFNCYSDMLGVEDFKSVTKKMCKLPSFFCRTLFKRIDTECKGTIRSYEFIQFWVTSNMMAMDKATQIYRILKQSNNNYLTKEDFKPIIDEFVEVHPYLQFLQKTPVFQEIYAQTVIYTIFYHLDKAGCGCITLKNLKHGDLIPLLQHVEDEKDLDKSRSRKYFSYKCFFVLYCKFCRLDLDCDFALDKYDLMRYGNNALSSRIIERIFSQIPRKFTCKIEGKMGYEDFIYFMLAEEYKSSEPSVIYWFKCLDLNGIGVITRNDLQYFFDEQLHRMNCLNRVVLLFENVLCQIYDIIHPENEDFLTLQDFKACQLSGVVFDVLFNIFKYLSFENYETFSKRRIRLSSNQTEWDIFVSTQHSLLVEDYFENDDAGFIDDDDEVSAMY